MKVHQLATLWTAAVVLSCSHLSAQSINPDESDTGIANDGSGNLSIVDMGYQARIGEYYSPGGIVYIMPFQLPTLAAGQSFLTAQLQTQLYAMGNSGTLGNADLYGIGAPGTPLVTSTPNISTSFYYQGPSDSANTLIQSDFLTPASVVRTDPTTGPFTTTDTAGDAALATFLNEAYDNGANAGDYVYLRVSYDLTTIPAGNNFYDLLTEDAGGTFEKPTLNYTAGDVSVPEPSTWALLGAGLIALVSFNRRRCTF